MSPQAKKRTLIAACGLLVTVLAWRVFYFQELFFALLLFAGVFFVLLLLACIVAGAWMLYVKAVIYLAQWTAEQGHRAWLPLRARLSELAPTTTKTTEVPSAARHTRFYAFGSSLRGLLQSLRLDASRFRADAERAVKHLRLLLKHS
jgi:hypothetical protein